MNTGAFKAGDVTVFDPAQKHHYQPAYTMVGGGVIGNAAKAKTMEDKYVVRSQLKMFQNSPQTKWVPKGVTSMQPESNKLTLDDGTEVEYEYLVVAPGCQLRFDQIKGASAALADESCPVGSIYTLKGAYKTSLLRESFKGGKAIFTLPTMPIKCGGAPQKIMYLSEETWRNKKISADVEFRTTVGSLFPNCQKFADALKPIAASKGINVEYFNKLVEIDGENRVATFENLQTGEN